MTASYDVRQYTENLNQTVTDPDWPERKNDVVENIANGDITLETTATVQAQGFELYVITRLEVDFDLALNIGASDSTFRSVGDVVGRFGLDGKLFFFACGVIFAE